MTTYKQVVILLGVALLGVVAALELVTPAQVLVLGLLWLGGCALTLADVMEITLGKLAIKRDVRDAREIRDQVRQQAQEILTIRAAIEQTEARVNAQAQSIDETSKRVAQSEAEVMRTGENLRKLGAKLFEAEFLMNQIVFAGVFRIGADSEQGEAYKAMSDELWSRVGRVMGEVATLSQMSGERVSSLFEELNRMMEEIPDELPSRKS